MDWSSNSWKKNMFDTVRFLLVKATHVYAVLPAIEASVEISPISDKAPNSYQDIKHPGRRSSHQQGPPGLDPHHCSRVPAGIEPGSPVTLPQYLQTMKR